MPKAKQIPIFEAMPYAIRNFEQYTNEDILDILNDLEYDRSYHSSYKISYGCLDKQHQKNMMKLSNIKFAQPYVDYQPDFTYRDAVCYARFGDIIGGFRQRYDQWPSHVWLSIDWETNLPVTWEVPEEEDDDDDWEDEFNRVHENKFIQIPDDEDDRILNRKNGVKWLDRKEAKAWYKWCKDTKLVPPFSVARLLDAKVVIFPFNALKSSQHMYFCLSLLRYAHEGQNICRRTMAIHDYLQCDPLLAVMLAHIGAKGAYNSGHAIAGTYALKSANSYLTPTFKIIATDAVKFANAWHKSQIKKNNKTLGWRWEGSVINAAEDNAPQNWLELATRNFMEV